VVNPAPKAPAPPAIRLLVRADVERLLDMPTCIRAVEAAFRGRAEGDVVRSGVLGLRTEEGGFHVKIATLDAGRPLFAAKVNSNFPANAQRHGLPTIQGLVALFDATTGAPLALMDSIAITILRTAAATAVAAEYLALASAATIGIVGCGAQALAQLTAVSCVRAITGASVFDIDPAKAERFARNSLGRLGFPVTSVATLTEATIGSQIVITCTPSTQAFLRHAHLSPGTFVAAVGADNEEKSEVDPHLMASAAVVVDSLDQCATIGDLHHALASGTMTRRDVRADLGDVVLDPSRGRHDREEIVIFDSTGVAIEDVAAAAVLYERAEREHAGTVASFAT
jgi:ornithine cyclodeaminase/alanine dehydrogenase-like protein (mu-crystallin family)